MVAIKPLGVWAAWRAGCVIFSRAAIEDRSTAFLKSVTRHLRFGVYASHYGMSGAERTRVYRERKRAGLAMVSIAIEPTAVSEWLVDTGFLEAWDVTDLSAVQAALQEAVAVWSQVCP
jgi:hypothetical protein